MGAVAFFEEFTDPRLAMLYDTVCAGRGDLEFFVDLAAELAVTTVVDVGCGTGVLACALAERGHRVIGVDPAAPMLDLARRRPGGDQVRWIDGDARALGEVEADLVVMTAHVAQIITDDEAWLATLGAVHRALRPGGRIAFDSRDPRVQEWGAGEIWAARRRFHHPVAGSFEMWQQAVALDGDLGECELYYALDDTGETLVSHTRLRFRTQEQLTAQLADTGFEVERIYGDFDRSPVGETTPELICVATRR